MYNRLKNILQDYSENRRSFNIDIIEKNLINNVKGYSKYISIGGYEAFHKSIKRLEEEGQIQGMKTVDYNGKKPPLKIKWTIIMETQENKWNDNEILKLSDLLDFTYYIRNPRLQTKQEWKYIESIYKFLNEKEEREWATLEERSLELFHDEKFLRNSKDNKKNKTDKGVIKRLKLTLEDLKIQKYGEMFIYWNRGVKEIKNVVILENYSTFYTYKRTVEENRDVFGFYPDGIIFGGGKKIINSFSFIKEIAPINAVKVLYFGDIDPEGFMIYHSLRKRYPDIDIALQISGYNALLDFKDHSLPCEGQRKNKEDLNFIIDEFRKKGFMNEGKSIEFLWENNLRLPQEFITYEYFKKKKGDISG